MTSNAIANVTRTRGSYCLPSARLRQGRKAADWAGRIEALHRRACGRTTALLCGVPNSLYHPAEDTSVKRILLVEDDTDLRRFFRTSLSMAGFDVEEASDGIEALHLIEN